ncbi:MAG: CocE/NonD family hydrolase [Pigmentiphaga sp.]|nr:CocE/NonD family hydrolase [Pigmentiphaga sp.]
MRTEVKDGMRITWQIPITMRDGVVLRADLFQPVEGGRYPVIMSYGCYAKGQSFQEAYAPQWEAMTAEFPEIKDHSTGKYQCWELADPERFVPHGYAVLRVDSRGAGWSEGVQDLWSKTEVEDYHECIEWAGTQDWSNGRVGLLGISYYAANQWLAAATQPKHLKAIIPWEGASDCYRELYYHGGIRCTFLDAWLPKQLAMQYGQGERARRNPNTGESCAGPTLPEAELANNYVDKRPLVKAHDLLDDYYDGVITDFSRVTVPLLSSANWGGQGLHLRGNLEGFMRSASEHKYLEIHGLEHWTHFYTDYGVGLQRRFFDRYLKEDASSWQDQPPVLLQIRHIDHFEERAEQAWPIPRTAWTPYYLDAASMGWSSKPAAEAHEKTYDVSGEGLTFLTAPFTEETEFTGPIAADLHLRSSSEDADLFLIVRLFDPQGKEITFRGAMDAHAPIAQGWLRASHRELDERLSTPWRPVHRHQIKLPLTPGVIEKLRVEIWPSSIVVPAGYRLGLTIQGRDYAFDGEMDPTRNARHRYPSKGCGPFLHNDPQDRQAPERMGEVTIHTGPAHPSFVLMPVIPGKANQR